MVDFESAMTHAGKTLESGSYDAGHGFVNPSSERYDADAADDAWGVTLGFLDRVLV
jgi:dienelactone hydrolase